jgi:ABC-2 type transport system ATP-binding protein
MASDLAISTDRLGKSYGRRLGIRDLSLRVPRGRVYGFIGPNGAGKTTLIRLLLGFLRPTAGAAAIFGADCWRASHLIKREVGYLPGDLRLPAWMLPKDALRVVSLSRRRDLLAPVRELMQQFELDPSTRVRDMSRGMRQKLGLILALVHEPRLLVLDEPTSALDPLTQERLSRVLRERAAAGATVFFSSHVLSEVQDLCDRVAIVRGGELVADEDLVSLQRRAGRSVRIRWSGAPPAAADCPPFLELAEARDGFWNCGLQGAVQPLLEWLRARAVADLEIGPPDLDRLFLSYYREGQR